MYIAENPQEDMGDEFRYPTQTNLSKSLMNRRNIYVIKSNFLRVPQKELKKKWNIIHLENVT